MIASFICDSDTLSDLSELNYNVYWGNDIEYYIACPEWNWNLGKDCKFCRCIYQEMFHVKM